MNIHEFVGVPEDGSDVAALLPLAVSARVEGASAAASEAAHLSRADIDRLIGREYASLRALLFRKVGDPHLAADLLNDAICTTWEKYRKGEIAHPGQIAGYVFQVAMNLLRNRRRLVCERPERRMDPEVLDRLSMEDCDDLDVDTEIVDKVIRIIRGMNSWRDRQVLVRFYLDEEDRETICRDLRMTPAQFATVLHRARQRLRVLLESHGVRRTDVFSWAVV